MKWPNLIFAAGILAWLHGFAAALCSSFGLDGFMAFAAIVAGACAIFTIIGLIARASADSTRRTSEDVRAERVDALIANVDKLHRSLNQWCEHTAKLVTRVEALEKSDRDASAAVQKALDRALNKEAK